MAEAAGGGRHIRDMTEGNYLPLSEITKAHKEALEWAIDTLTLDAYDDFKIDKLKEIYKLIGGYK